MAIERSHPNPVSQEWISSYVAFLKVGLRNHDQQVVDTWIELMRNAGYSESDIQDALTSAITILMEEENWSLVPAHPSDLG